MKLYCVNCDRVTLKLTDDDKQKILDNLHGPADCHREECPECHRYQWELAARALRRSSS